MKLSRNTWISIIGTLTLALITTATIIIKLSAPDHGFIQDNGQPVSWSKQSLPVLVQIDPSALDWLDTIDQTADAWNTVVGRPVFRVQLQPFATGLESIIGLNHSPYRHRCQGRGSPGDPVVFVSLSESDMGGEGGVAHLFWVGQEIRCVDVVLARNAPKDLRMKIVAHELGHALGLTHDGIEDSVMFYGGRALGWGMEKVTEKDKALLRAVYGLRVGL